MPVAKAKTTSCDCFCRTFGAGWELCDPSPDCEYCGGSGKREHPKMRYTRHHAICPQCGFNGGGSRDGGTDLEAFDVILADHGCVFCPECHQEIAT